MWVLQAILILLKFISDNGHGCIISTYGTLDKIGVGRESFVFLHFDVSWWLIFIPSYFIIIRWISLGFKK